VKRRAFFGTTLGGIGLMAAEEAKELHELETSSAAPDKP